MPSKAPWNFSPIQGAYSLRSVKNKGKKHQQMYSSLCFYTDFTRSLCSRGTSPVELSSGPAVQSRHQLQTVQTTAQGIPFSGSMNTALCD